ncbi:MAG: DUF4105 domain-containing protein [Muribaculaceae bacterium]|nr:DUF4105 domain-containing protein [Muribaculaceae bacterium]
MKRGVLVLALVLSSVVSWAQHDSISATAPRISLITCHAGSVMYELCGHTAIRVQIDNNDMAVNYGLFEFQADNFALKFLKGETDYRVGAYPFNLFLEHYLKENRKIIEQELNLTPQQAWELVELLNINLLPENCVYRYNYVKNNCATKPIVLIEQVVNDTIAFNEPSIKDAQNWTFRDEMRHFHKNYLWYQLGIDLALGSGIDYKLPTREKMFAPEALESMMRGATITDSSGNKIPIVNKEIVIHEGEPAPLPLTPFLLSPIFIFSIILVLTIIYSIKDIKKQQVSRWFDFIIFGAYSLASLFVCFLVFISVNEATSPNYIILLFSPLCFIPTICVWIKKLSKIVYYSHLMNIVTLILLIIVLFSGIQVTNIAVVPLILISLIRSVSYIYINRCNTKKIK